MDDLQSITQALLSGIREKLTYTQSIFDLWFADLKLVSLSDSKAELMTSTKLRKKILSTKHYDLIKESLAEVIGFDVDITIDSEDNDEGFVNPLDAIKVKPMSAEEIAEREDEKNRLKEYIDNPNSPRFDQYTFDTFIEGESNKFARAACLAVAREPNTYNPLFIHGHSGLGKTHLLYAIINYLRQHHPELKIVYKKSEDFINELVKSLSDGTTAQFKENYRTADVLLIDDIQFIAGKVSTQEEFFHTFSKLYESEKQIILTSDRPPKDISPLEDRLRTRFEGGLIADVQPPTFELRTAIIRKKCEVMNLSLSPDLINYIAERMRSDIRQIEGLLKKIQAFQSLNGNNITTDAIDEAIKIIDPDNIPIFRKVERINAIVAKHYSITTDDLTSKKKTEIIAQARHVAIYLIRKLTDLSYTEIGRYFSRDHTTVMASYEKVEVNIKTIRQAGIDIQKLITEINGNSL